MTQRSRGALLELWAPASGSALGEGHYECCHSSPKPLGGCYYFQGPPRKPSFPGKLSGLCASHSNLAVKP